MAVARFFDRASLAVAGALAAPTISAASLRQLLGEVVVEVRCASASPAIESDNWIAELLVNLLARLYPTLRIEGPEAVKNTLKRLARAINPSLDFGDGATGTIVAAIGEAPVTGSEVFRVRSDGWVARVLAKPQDLPRGPPNPYAAAAAACLAAAEVFRRAFASMVPVAHRLNVSLSLLDYSTASGELEALTPVMDLGEVAFVGIGAVASGALWALARHSGVRGELHLIDPDAVELSNLQRYALLDMSTLGKPKVRIAARCLERQGLRVKMHRKTIEGLAGERGRGFTAICVSVDNVEGRRAAQALLPRIVFNGWTHGSGLGVSWHRFVSDTPCLACLYMPTGDRLSQMGVIAQTLGLQQREASELYLTNGIPTEEQLQRIAAKTRASAETIEWCRGKPLRELFTEVCGAANLTVRDDGQPEAVPLAHQSALAGVMMAAELVKRSSEGLGGNAQVENVLAWHDVTGPVPLWWTEPFSKDPRCICSDATYKDAYRAKWCGGKDVPNSLHADPARDLVVRQRAPRTPLKAVNGA